MTFVQMEMFFETVRAETENVVLKTIESVYQGGSYKFAPLDSLPVPVLDQISVPKNQTQYWKIKLQFISAKTLTDSLMKKHSRWFLVIFRYESRGKSIVFAPFG